jgi:Endoglucanase
MHRLTTLAWLLVMLLFPSTANAQQTENPPAIRKVYLDHDGVIRWTDTREEVTLFGANYAIASSGDYRAAGYVSQNRKRLIDEDMAQFARMGWTGMRIAFWGDWQNSDRSGNLIVNDHLDLLDYLISKARERGIYILFNPIHTYDAGWPDALQDTFPGFAAHIPKDKLGTDPAAIAAQVNYLKQILNHVNPYTHTALKDEPSILFIEMINEPIHHPEDLAGSVRYIDALADAVRSTGSKAILFHNVSQDFAIAPAIQKSEAQGASFGWYPTGLNSGHELAGNYLRTVDDYPGFKTPELTGKARLVYEFDSADGLTGYMYPAMIRTFRAGGVQLAAMFAYDMLETASRNLGWQTHHLNLVYTPRKAMSAVIAAEAMRRLPRMKSYGSYPQNTTFGPFRVSYEENLSEMVTPDAFLYSSSTRTVPKDLSALQRVAGYGSSPLVSYEGQGVYFLDRVRAGVWRLEVYPDAVPVEDPFEQPRRDKIVTRAIYRDWPMELHLPDLGASFSVEAVAAGNPHSSRADNGRFSVRPGVYVLSANGPVDRATLPSRVGFIGFGEFHAPKPDILPLRVKLLAASQHLSHRPIEIAARVVSDSPPDSVFLWVRPDGAGWFHRYSMQPAGGYEYRAVIPADSLPEGTYKYVISVRTGDSTVTFPGESPGAPWDWDFNTGSFWHTTVTAANAPLRLFWPEADASRLAFSRIGDGGRAGIFRIVPSLESGEPALHLTLPVNVGGISPDDYTTSLVIKDLIDSRKDAISLATAVRLKLRGTGPRQHLHVTLMEKDGTSWSANLLLDSLWSEKTVPLSDFRIARGVKLPQGFPGTWNYWVNPPPGRGGSNDSIRIADVERLQLSLRRDDYAADKSENYGVEVESVTLLFRKGK